MKGHHIHPICFLALIFLGLSSYSQRMNHCGHFPQVGSAARMLDHEGKEIAVNGLKLQGNAAWETPEGYVTLGCAYENAPSTMRYYDASGRLLRTQEFRQIVNFTLSDNGRYCAFHDMTQLQVIDLQKWEVHATRASNVFAIDDAGQLAYFEEENGIVHFADSKFAVAEPIYRIVMFQGRPIFIGYRKMYVVNGGDLQTIFEEIEGRIFSAIADGNTLRISTKTEQPCAFKFQEYSTEDLQRFALGNASEYPLARCSDEALRAAATPPSANRITTGEAIKDPIDFFSQTVYQPVGNSYDELQEYTLGSPYLHPGVDLMGTYLQNVHAVKGGVVKAVLTISAQYHWRVAIANQNIATRSPGYLYAHLEETLIPYTVGDLVAEGDVIGQLVDFPNFVHLHFARITDAGATWSGNWWTFDNPLRSMTNFADSIAPQFEMTTPVDKFAFRNISGQYLSPNNLLGDVKVISKFHDRINDTWHVEVDSIRYNLSALAAPQVYLLDTVFFVYNTYNDQYFAGPYQDLIIPTIYSRDPTCFSASDYNVRDYFHIVTNSDGNDTITVGDQNEMFHTTDFPNGNYIFRIVAWDAVGNSKADSMVITINNPAVGAAEGADQFLVRVYPNPSANGQFQIVSEMPLRYEVCDAMGRRVTDGRLASGESNLTLPGVPNGIYGLRLWNGAKVSVQQLIVQR